MKILFPVFMILILSSCKNDEKKGVEKKIFIVSKFNNDIQKHSQNAIAKNPELSKIKEIKLYDYPKGAVNFIILNNGNVYFYNEELISNWCGWGSEKMELMERQLRSDSLHRMNFNQIYPLLQYKLRNRINDNNDRLAHLSFSFENDTIKNFDIYKLLKNIDSLGYHSYNIRRIAPFESKAINHKKYN